MTLSIQVSEFQSDLSAYHPAFGRTEQMNTLTTMFQRVLLQCRPIHISQLPALGKIPREFFEHVEQACQDLDRYTDFTRALQSKFGVLAGQQRLTALTASLLAQSDEWDLSIRAFNPSFDCQTISGLCHLGWRMSSPARSMLHSSIIFGFSTDTFSTIELNDLPMWLTPVGTSMSHSPKKQNLQKICCPYFFLNTAMSDKSRTLLQARERCSVDASVALAGLKLLFDEARHQDSELTLSVPVIFSCAADSETIVLNHHWASDEQFFMATMCVLSLNDSAHIMYFLAWLEAVEQWAETNVLPEIREALRVLRSETSYPDVAESFKDRAKQTEQDSVTSSAYTSHISYEPLTPSTGLASQRTRTPLSVTGCMRPSIPCCSTADLTSEKTTSHDAYSDSRERKPCSDDGIMTKDSLAASTTKEKRSKPSLNPEIRAKVSQRFDNVFGHTRLRRVRSNIPTLLRLKSFRADSEGKTIMFCLSTILY